MARLTLPTLCALVVLLAPVVVRGDVIRLRTGETVKGRVVTERTNEQVLVVEDYLAGAEREIAWGAVDPSDASRLQEVLRLGTVGDVTIPCDILSYKLDDGSVVQVRGVVVKEEGGVVFLRNRSQKEPLQVRKERVVEREKGECDPQEVYAPEELAETKKGELQPQDARTWLNLAQYCEAVGAWAAAKEAYENAAVDETFLNRKIAQEGAARVEAILRDKEALDTLNALKMAMSAEQWKRVRDGIEGFATKHPSAGDAVKKKLESLKTEFTDRRTKALASLAGRRFEVIVRELVRKRVAPKDAEFNTVQGWIRKECVEEAMASLLAELQKADPAVTPEEAKSLWDARPKRAWRNAKYGSGTRFVEPPKILPKTGVKQQPQQNKGGGPAPVLKLPEPPSRDDWWHKLTTDERRDFWWAVFVEKSGLFEVDPKKEKKLCDRCQGDGTLSFTMSNGLSATTLCDRCAGARFDLEVRYR